MVARTAVRDGPVRSVVRIFLVRNFLVRSVVRIFRSGFFGPDFFGPVRGPDFLVRIFLVRSVVRICWSGYPYRSVVRIFWSGLSVPVRIFVPVRNLVRIFEILKIFEKCDLYGYRFIKNWLNRYHIFHKTHFWPHKDHQSDEFVCM